MPILKYYNQTTSQWEPVVVGKAGPQGIQGIQGETGTGPVNAIINGAFEIYQRGAGSQSYTNTAIYHPDRWGIFRAGFATGCNGIQVSSGLTGIPFAHRVQRASGNSSTNFIMMGQPIETINSEPLQGQAVTLSAWIRRGANFSGSTNNLIMNIDQGTGINSSQWIGYNLTPINESKPITESWVRHSITGTIAASAKSVGVSFSYTPTGTAGSDDWFEVTGVQLELGSTITPFRRHAPSLQGELVACQRYAFSINIPSEGAFTRFGQGQAFQTNAVQVQLIPPVRLRTQPISVTSSGTIALFDGTSFLTASSITLDTPTTNAANINVVSSGLSQHRPYVLIGANSSAASIIVSAEL
jgi:hypothetical protein